MQQVAPLKVGMFLFEKVMTQRSTPVVLTILPGRIVIAAANRVLAVQDPQASRLELAGITWVGEPTVADGTYQGAFRSVGRGESRMQRRIAPAAEAALLAAGVRRA